MPQLWIREHRELPRDFFLKWHVLRATSGRLARVLDFLATYVRRAFRFA